MKPIEFPEQNCVIAKDQKPYLPLPAHRTEDGKIISCWRFTFWERIKMLFGNKLWIWNWTFNSPLQPQCPTLDYPFETERADVKRAPDIAKIIEKTGRPVG